MRISSLSILGGGGEGGIALHQVKKYSFWDNFIFRSMHAKKK